MNRGYRSIDKNNDFLPCSRCGERLHVADFDIVQKKLGLYYDSWCRRCRYEYKKKPRWQSLIDYDIPVDTKEKWQYAKKHGLLIYPLSMEKNG